MNLCACMGPQRGDPFCHCEMKRRGLEPTGPSEQEKREFQEALARFCRDKAASTERTETRNHPDAEGE